MKANSEAFSEPCKTSQMEVFTKTVKDFLSITTFTKTSMLHLRCWTKF